MKLNWPISNICCLGCFLNDLCELNDSRVISGPVLVRFSEIVTTFRTKLLNFLLEKEIYTKIKSLEVIHYEKTLTAKFDIVSHEIHPVSV